MTQKRKAEGKSRISSGNPSNYSKRWQTNFKQWELYHRRKYNIIQMIEITNILGSNSEIESIDFVNYLLLPDLFWKPSPPSIGKVYTSTGYDQEFLKGLIPR